MLCDIFLIKRENTLILRFYKFLFILCSVSHKNLLKQTFLHIT